MKGDKLVRAAVEKPLVGLGVPEAEEVHPDGVRAWKDGGGDEVVAVQEAPRDGLADTVDINRGSREDRAEKGKEGDRGRGKE